MMLNIKQLLLYIGLLLCVLLQVCRSKSPQYCPNFCSCDLHEERNRALCSAKRLISANIEMPKAVEILDLSFNDITSIDSGCLQSYVHLINLTLAHNAIHTIHMDAFAELRALQAIDLSYNRLEYIDEHLIESNRRLSYVNLEGNKFMALAGNRPLLRSTSLRILNLRNAQISQVDGELLSALPQLEILDLAQNLILTLNSAAFSAPHRLEMLDLNENPLNCDHSMVQLMDVLHRRGITISVSDCYVQNNEQASGEQKSLIANKDHNDGNDGNVGGEQPMFERMELRDSEAKQTNKEALEQTTPLSPVDVLQVWRELSDSNEDDDEDSDDRVKSDNSVCEGQREKLCQRYRNCLERVSHMIFEQEEGAQEFLERKHTYTEDDVKLAFIIGGATGICIVIFIITCALCVKSCCEMRRKHAQAQQEGTTTPILTVSVPDIDVVPPTVPSRIRIPRRSNPVRRIHQAQHSRALERQPYGPQDNFISRLFGRPARHQYYRTINQNTATLIRRLSRSNLFNNRFNEPSSPTTSSPMATAQFYDDYEAIPARVANIANAPSRPETPPPNYGDVVIDNCDRK